MLHDYATYNLVEAQQQQTRRIEATKKPCGTESLGAGQAWAGRKIGTQGKKSQRGNITADKKIADSRLMGSQPKTKNREHIWQNDHANGMKCSHWTIKSNRYSAWEKRSELEKRGTVRDAKENHRTAKWASESHKLIRRRLEEFRRRSISRTRRY